MLITQLPQPRQILRRRDLHPAFPLDGLHQNGTGLGVNRRLHSLQIIIGDKGKSGQQRLKPLPELLLPGSRQGGQGPAVKRILGADDLVAVPAEFLPAVTPA